MIKKKAASRIRLRQQTSDLCSNVSLKTEIAVFFRFYLFFELNNLSIYLHNISILSTFAQK